MAGMKKKRELQPVRHLIPAVKKPRKQSVSETKSINPNLWIPEEIQAHILQKLPDKSLTRFTSVCNSWNSIIYDPKLVNLACKLLLSSGKSIYVMDYAVSEGTVRKLDLPLKTKGYLNIMGSCNGLLLICTAEIYYIWNTMTGKYKILPIEYRWWQSLGLGFDYSTNDYKIIAVFEELHVYSLKEDSWRKAHGKITHARSYCMRSPGTLINNSVLYWRATCETNVLYTEEGSCVIRKETEVNVGDENQYRLILRVDLVDESKVLILQPPGIEGTETEFMEFKGSLCAYECKEGRNIEMWILKEENAKLNWRLLMSIQQPHSLPYRSFLAPIYFARNGEVLMNVRNIVRDVAKRTTKFFTYNSKEKRFRRFILRGINYWSNVMTYNGINSLALLAMDGVKYNEIEEALKGVELVK